MYAASERIRKIQDELKEINTLKPEILKRNDPAEIKATRKKIMDAREGFRACATKLEQLDQYVQDGLARPDLSMKEVKELELLREQANQARMAIKASGGLLQEFPE